MSGLTLRDKVSELLFEALATAGDKEVDALKAALDEYRTTYFRQTFTPFTKSLLDAIDEAHGYQHCTDEGKEHG